MKTLLSLKQGFRWVTTFYGSPEPECWNACNGERESSPVQPRARESAASDWCERVGFEYETRVYSLSPKNVHQPWPLALK